VRWLLGAPFLLLATPTPAVAADLQWGGSLRVFQFLRVDSPGASEPDRRDSELATLRLTNESRLAGDWRFSAHGVLSFASPSAGAATTPLAAGREAGLDRLNLQGPVGRARLVAGRQAITWGTSFFWPALDLFAPFAPAQIERDYKRGVDAVRLTLPLGAFSELEAVGAVLGGSLRRDRAAAMLARIHLGGADVGVMGGDFHGDTVLGGFVTSELGGTGMRGELAHTRSGDPGDVIRGRARFWRGSIGVDRLLTPVLSLTAELAWNGYGVGDPALYPALAGAQRIRRGEVNALGRQHAGVALAWEIHPLWRLGNTVLSNLRDRSVLWAPTLRWSTSDESEALFGAAVPFGRRAGPDARPRSEYGLAPAMLFVGFKAYF
jgi:hypothetical protein